MCRHGDDELHRSRAWREATQRLSEHELHPDLVQGLAVNLKRLFCLSHKEDTGHFKFAANDRLPPTVLVAPACSADEHFALFLIPERELLRGYVYQLGVVRKMCERHAQKRLNVVLDLDQTLGTWCERTSPEYKLAKELKFRILDCSNDGQLRPRDQLVIRPGWEKLRDWLYQHKARVFVCTAAAQKRAEKMWSLLRGKLPYKMLLAGQQSKVLSDELLSPQESASWERAFTVIMDDQPRVWSPDDVPHHGAVQPFKLQTKVCTHTHTHTHTHKKKKKKKEEEEEEQEEEGRKEGRSLHLYSCALVN